MPRGIERQDPGRTTGGGGHYSRRPRRFGYTGAPQVGAWGGRVRTQAVLSVAYRRRASGLTSQAIPLAVHQRRALLAQLRPRLPLLITVATIVALAVSPSSLAQQRQASVDTEPLALGRVAGGPVPSANGANAAIGAEVTTIDVAAAPGPVTIARGSASVSGIGAAAATNVEIAISFVDGIVIEPGAQLSFDDTARTWDFREDPSYVMGTATSARGLIAMRGGGVCWLSTALWRAALVAGIRTDFRESHYGLVDPLGPGVDATNTLVIRNDAPVAITVRAWLDEDDVHVDLLADRPLDRTAIVEGPYRVGLGRYVVYQEVTWDDGRATSSEFPSWYLW